MPTFRWPRALVMLESLALLASGFALLTFLYTGSVDKIGDEIGVPEHDSFYHIKMALLMTEHGLLRELPWLQYVYFRQQGNEFVNHHYGFQALLMPFVHLSQAIYGDALPGGRWAIATFFGLNLTLFNLLLRQAGVRLRWAWIVLFLLLPDQFLGRHAFIRAIAPSLALIQLVLLFLFRGWWRAAAISIAAYIQLYLGAVTYTPVIVAAYALGFRLRPAEEPRRSAAMALWCAGGWMLGILVHPYSRGMLEFLPLQILGSGLAPDIEVGLEWRPYTDAWFLVNTSAVTLGVWVTALVVRARKGPALDAQETALLIIQFVFLLLTLKARRFIEYWPYVALLNAAFMLRPALNDLQASLARAWHQGSVATRIGGVAVVCIAVFAAAAWGLGRLPGQRNALLFLAEWRLWVLLLTLLALAPLAAIWSRHWVAGERDGLVPRVGGVLLFGAAIVAGCAGLLHASGIVAQLPAPRLAPPVTAWAGIAALYVIVAAFTSATRQSTPPVPFGGRAAMSGLLALGCVGLFGGLAAVAAHKFGELSKGTRCVYRLDEIRTMMRFVRENSQPGDIIFTDDWDVFPVYFYINSHNHYIVGLDPKFTHERRPDLWARYVRITRGETPARVNLLMPGPGGKRVETSIDAALSDIREHFEAKWVIVDSDHRRFALKLLDAPDVAELAYPAREFDRCSDAPYWVFRVRPGSGAGTADFPPPDSTGHLFLSQLRPASHSQGFGDLRADASVDGQTLRMRGLSYSRGIGTHAPSETSYDIPSGFDFFEAMVGIDDETDGRGSIIASVHLDGRKVFESPVLTGRTQPVVIRIPLGGAKQLMLRTEATADGQRFDHVDWAEARFTRRKSAATTQVAP